MIGTRSFRMSLFILFFGFNRMAEHNESFISQRKRYNIVGKVVDGPVPEADGASS